jgi:NADH-quinone oxidoreductase subunit N
MNLSLLNLEIAVIVLGLGVLLLDLWLPEENRPKLGYLAAIGLGLILLASFFWSAYPLKLVVMVDQPRVVEFQMPAYAFGGSYVMDFLALFFKRFFLLAAALVLLLARESANRLPGGISEYYGLILFALAGMMFASSANDLVMLFVTIELITVTFYVLTSFQRNRLGSLEAGVKYLILGGLSSALMAYGIALVFGLSGTVSFPELAKKSAALANQPLFLFGLGLVLAGLGFKIAAVPMQMWTPDVYQGAPTPTTAFLAVGSKAAGFALLLRVLFVAVPAVTVHWSKLQREPGRF